MAKFLWSWQQSAKKPIRKFLEKKSDKKWNFLQNFPAASIGPRSPTNVSIYLSFLGKLEGIHHHDQGEGSKNMCTLQPRWMTMPSSLRCPITQTQNFLWHLSFHHFWVQFPSISGGFVIIDLCGQCLMLLLAEGGGVGHPACCRKNQ